METEHLIEQAIAAVRASTILELRMAHGHTQENMTSEEVTSIVDWALYYSRS